MNIKQLIVALQKHPMNAIPVIQLEGETIMSFDISSLTEDDNLVCLNFGKEL